MIRTPFFYGYIIISLCFLNMFLMRGILASFGVLYVALLDDFEWSRATAASIASANALVYGASSPLVGWSYDRLGPRILMPVGGLLIGSGLILSAQSSSLWQFYIFYGLFVGLGLGGIGFVSNSALLSHWFRQRRATAIGLATMGLGMGILIVVPTITILISWFGWRTALVLAGVTVLAVVVPLNALLQRRRPEDIGQLADGATTMTASTASESANQVAADHDWTLKSALFSFPFWTIAMGHLVLGTGLSLMYTHVVAHMINAGLDTLAAASIFALVGAARIPGTAIWGFISDRLDRARAYGLGTLMTVGGIAVLMVVTPGVPTWWLYAWLYAFVLLYGLGHSAGNPTYGATIADIFGGKKVGTIFGFLEITFGLGMAIGPWFGGFVHDITGSYHYALILGLVCFALSYLSIYVSMVWQRRSQQAELEPA